MNANTQSFQIIFDLRLISGVENMFVGAICGGGGGANIGKDTIYFGVAQRERGREGEST